MNWEVFTGTLKKMKKDRELPGIVWIHCTDQTEKDRTHVLTIHDSFSGLLFFILYFNFNFLSSTNLTCVQIYFFQPLSAISKWVNWVLFPTSVKKQNRAAQTKLEGFVYKKFISLWHWHGQCLDQICFIEQYKSRAKCENRRMLEICFLFIQSQLRRNLITFASLLH